jgi:hypothetical protein
MPAVTSSGPARAQFALAVLGALSILPPYLGPVIGLELDVAAKVEVVDHVAPGVIVVVCGMLAALLARRDEEIAHGAPALGLAGLCFLAGLWQTATHVPLVFDAGGAAAPWDAVLLHSVAGPMILVLALWLTLRTPASDSADVRASG